MKNTYYLLGLFAFPFMSISGTKPSYDVTVVGSFVYADGLGRLGIGFIDSLKKELKVNALTTYAYNPTDIPLDVQSIVRNPHKTPAPVSILFDVLWNVYVTPAYLMPSSFIKIAYSMIESTAIPLQWVSLLNTRFDAVVVPDPSLVPVYKSCGVKIPIFVVPCGLYLDEFLEQPLHTRVPQAPFVFGMSAGFFSDHKNHELLIDAFTQEFGNTPEVTLKLHGRLGDADLQKRVLDKIKALGHNTITFINRNLSKHDYNQFIRSLDCYVLLSRGEGFSITPREALACGIPCILTNNSAQKTLCASGFVRAVPSEIPVIARYSSFGSVCGYHANCTIQDARAALRDVYTHYAEYAAKAEQGREWVRQYTHKNVQKKYITLVKPTKVVLDTYNSIEDTCIITNSQPLYKKYKYLKRLHKKSVK